MKRTAGLVLGALIATSLVALPARGQLLYDNGAPNYDNAFSLTYWRQADDFTLLTSATLGGIRFWAAQENQDPDSVFSWQILRDSLGEPQTAVASGLSAWTRDDPAQLDPPNSAYITYAYLLELDSLVLGPGTYWLSLHSGSLTHSDPYPWIGWVTTTRNSTAPSLGDAYPFGDGFVPTGTETDLAFQLYGTGGIPETTIPEPATLLLLGSGLAGLAAARRRRRSRNV